MVCQGLEKTLQHRGWTFYAPHDDDGQLRGTLKKLGEDLNNLLVQIQVASEQIDSRSSQVSESAQPPLQLGTRFPDQGFMCPLIWGLRTHHVELLQKQKLSLLYPKPRFF